MSKSTINPASQRMALQRSLRWYESHAEFCDRHWYEAVRVLTSRKENANASHRQNTD